MDDRLGPLRVVGEVVSPLGRIEDCPSQPDEGAPGATLVMTPEVIDALNGLEPGDPILVLTWLHHADRDVLTTRPRGERERRLTGVFATRSPDRPNPIGIHATTIMGIRGSEVDVTHLEVVNGTPIVDLKPVLGRISQR